MPGSGEPSAKPVRVAGERGMELPHLEQTNGNCSYAFPGTISEAHEPSGFHTSRLHAMKRSKPSTRCLEAER